MKSFLRTMFRRVAPGAAASLSDLAQVRSRYGSIQAALESVDADGIQRLTEENRRLREEIDELRREGRYVAELYDLVIERVRVDSE
ncbi:hypothetical protein ACX9R5_15725 [Rathayibacter sp. CAU 1779]